MKRILCFMLILLLATLCPAMAETADPVVVRHLLLPGQLRDSFAVMRHLVSKPYHGHVCVSLMSQYTPMPGVGCAYPELAQQVEREDYDALVDYALALGLENSFMQEGAAAQESFIPQFDYEGV